MARLPGARSQRRTKYDAQAKLWAAMRILRRFTLPELVTVTAVNYDHTRKFLKRLDQAGYVRKLAANDNGRAGSFAVFCLYRDTGPKPPIIGIDGVAYDQNLHRHMEAAYKQAKARRQGLARPPKERTP